MGRQGVGLALVRIILGSWFLWSGLQKLKPVYAQEQLTNLLRFFAEHGTIDFYRGFLQWAADHARIFAYVTSWGEIAIGGLLILGLLTTVAVWAMIFFCANYLLATFKLGPANIGVNFLCIGTGLALWAGAGGRVLGVDALFCSDKKKENESLRNEDKSNDDSHRP